MQYNTYILDWTMNEYDELKTDLMKLGFEFVKEEGKEHLRVKVLFERIDEFEKLIQQHLNAPYNYVDVSFPEQKLLYIVFGIRVFKISNKDENKQAQEWAISIGLPSKQAVWEFHF